MERQDNGCHPRGDIGCPRLFAALTPPRTSPGPTPCKTPCSSDNPNGEGSITVSPSAISYGPFPIAYVWMHHFPHAGLLQPPVLTATPRQRRYATHCEHQCSVPGLSPVHLTRTEKLVFDRVAEAVLRNPSECAGRTSSRFTLTLDVD
jgi:hypothetical protein